MNYTGHRKLRLAARNEGKIKSYESCIDVRAWSHDIRTRNRYLRDWIKCDMPICLVPVCTLTSILSIMTYSSREKINTRRSSRCHSRCQSKVLLDRLCSSCTMMKDCLSSTKEFEKYFKEEEFETYHWPCEKCLEVLKSIKMFWKIVVERVLKISLPKSNDLKYTQLSSIKNIAKEWQQEMIEEAIFVNSNTFLFKQNNIFKKETDSEKEIEMNRNDKCFVYNCRSKATQTDCEFRDIAIQMNGRYVRQKISKCQLANINTKNLDYECNSVKDNEVIMIYKNDIKNLQRQYNVQKNEVERLKKENKTLIVEIQRFRHNDLKAIDNSITLFSNPIDSKENVDTPLKDVESEMIITLKNCKNENFRHVSIMQVLHKTNELNLAEINASYCKKQDPIDLLNKVHETFEAMVNRELSIASKTDESVQDKNVIIKSTFCNVGESRSVPSSTVSSYSMPESKFESATETQGTSLRSRN